jgi:UDP-N-acetylmuramyl pentapeptide phosphotransferase/UDP-N-acetylglucosamine-1-phosphate transferase
VWHLLLASLLVFGFFNFRKKAKAFAGDVGSISMAIIISFLIALLMIQTQEFKWILLLAVYGLDTVATICCRVVRKENIFKAHRSHFYQYLANEKKWSHLLISTLYAVLQLSINVLLIYFSDSLAALLFFFLLIIFYISMRLILEGRDRLFKNYNVLVL